MAIPKNKTIINIDDYTGFRWNGKHTSQLGLTIVSSSSRYNLNPISSITNNTVDGPGGDGQYFFNSTYGPKKWTINFFFDNLDDYQWRDLCFIKVLDRRIQIIMPRKRKSQNG